MRSFLTFECCVRIVGADAGAAEDAGVRVEWTDGDDGESDEEGPDCERDECDGPGFDHAMDNVLTGRMWLIYA